MSTAAHPETDGQTERVNRVLEEILRSYAHSFESWSEFLSMAEFAINNSVHASTSCTPFYVNGLRHPRTPPGLGGESNLSGGGTSAPTSSITNDSLNTRAEEFVHVREAIVRFVKDSIAAAVDKQKQNADKTSRANKNIFKLGDYVLLSTSTLPPQAVTQTGSNKLLPKFIGPFRVIHRKGDTYTLDLPKSMKTHPTFYVGRLRPYRSHSDAGEREQHAIPLEDSCSHESNARDSISINRSLKQQDRDLPSSVSFHQPTRQNEKGLQGSMDLSIEGHHNSREGSVRILPPPAPPLRDSQGTSRWIVDHLVEHRTRKLHGNDEREYRVRWLGYPPSADTWEPSHVFARMFLTS